MIEKINSNLNNPKELERLYRLDKNKFKNEFNAHIDSFEPNDIIEVWKERLNFKNEVITSSSKNELLYIFIACLFSGIIAKLPNFTSIETQYFYPKNISFIFLPILMVYFSLKNNNKYKLNFIAFGLLLFSIIYINFFPNDLLKSDSVILACLHLPLFLWSLLGITFVGNNFNNFKKRIDYLKYNGDLIVLTTIILIAGGILSSLTIGLFSIIDLNIERLYLEYVVVLGLSSSPIVATYLIKTNPNLINKVSPIIASVFTPLVFVTLVIYLITVVIMEKNPYYDRDFLLVFNILLIIVLAIILFSIVEKTKKEKKYFGLLMLLGLSLVTLVINGIALSAILFRINEWGITPNRLAVLGSNILILIHLVIVSLNLFKTVFKKSKTEVVEKAIAFYLPIYSLWTLIVVFLFPIFFDFK